MNRIMKIPSKNKRVILTISALALVAIGLAFTSRSYPMRSEIYIKSLQLRGKPSDEVVKLIGEPDKVYIGDDQGVSSDWIYYNARKELRGIPKIIFVTLQDEIVTHVTFMYR